MSLIQINELTFRHDGGLEPVFDHATFRFDTDWKLGLVGRNGRGKSTLLQLLQGRWDYSGKISAPGLTFSNFPAPVDDPRRSALEIAQEAAPVPLWRLQRELALLEMPPALLDRPFCCLSGGEQTKLLLSLLFLSEGDYPLIDEPTNHLDLAARAAVARYLRGKGGFLLISHDRALLDGCTDHTLALTRTGTELVNGGFSVWLAEREQRNQSELEENRRLRQDIRRLEEAARRTQGWSDRVEQTKYSTKNSGLRPDRGYLGHKSAKLMKRAKSMEARQEQAAAEKSKLLKNVEQSPPLKLQPLRHHAQTLAWLKNVAVTYDGRAVCREVSFTVEQGERLALCGRNGSGKSSLLRLLAPPGPDYTGEVWTAGGLHVSFVPQDAAFLSGSLSAFIARHGLDESLFKAILRKLDFSRAQFELDMGGYSAGQKKKVLLAKSLCEKAHLYVWDEPLNYIDVFSRIQLEELLRDSPCTLLVVEHDNAFLDRIGARRVSL
ncbi:putative ABC transporter ATP-binding protein YheS [bioreactor metagenome]|uniref:Putative ABC transporter ATP-binding protein YheS n=1 Tax=bioreactor metagenome TaxID=1076179 RepID=A0A644YYD3_9ZZZZ